MRYLASPLIAVVLLAAGAARAQDAALDRAAVRKVVERTGATVRTAQPPDRPGEPENGDFLGSIRPLVERPAEALPHLRALRDERKMLAFELRLCELLIERLEKPALFAAVVPYLGERPPNPLGILAAGGIDRPSEPLHPLPFPRIELDLLHPDVRAAAARRPEPARALLAAYEEVAAAAAAAKDVSEIPPLGRAFAERVAAVLAFAKEDRALEEDARLLRSLVEPLVARGPRLDPRHLPAWEEAAARPFPWPLKRSLAFIVAGFDDPASLPTLGVVLRSGLAAGRGRERPVAARAAMFDAFEKIVEEPGEAAAIELAQTIPWAREARDAELLRAMKARLSASQPWRDAIEALSRRPELAEHVALLKEVIESK